MTMVGPNPGQARVVGFFSRGSWVFHQLFCCWKFFSIRKMKNEGVVFLIWVLQLYKWEMIHFQLGWRFPTPWRVILVAMELPKRLFFLVKKWHPNKIQGETETVDEMFTEVFEKYILNDLEEVRSVGSTPGCDCSWQRVGLGTGICEPKNVSRHPGRG